MRISISYFDQNESLRPFFPARGLVSAESIRSAQGEHDWRRVELDQPMVTPVGELRSLLIASRWKGHGTTDPGTSVFVVGIPVASPAPSQGFDVNAYPLLIWGMATPE